MIMRKLIPLLVLACAVSAVPLRAQLKLPAIIGDHMVLQQKQADPIWGWDKPGATITVTFAGQSKTAQAGPDGKWTVTLDPVPANDKPQTIKIEDGTQTIEIQDVLVGEVWMCSGQSNMGFQLREDWNGDLEVAAAKYPNMRLIKVPLVGTQQLQDDFKGSWKPATPQSAANFSAVGFLYGRYLHQILGVPVGLIDNSWGGSAAEAWVRRSSIESDPRFAPLMERTVKDETYKQSEKAKSDYAAAMEKYKTNAARAKAEGRVVPSAPQSPQAWLTGNARPGNIFAGVVNPTRGYGIKGVIWYQGESNAGQPKEYAQLFPFLIEQWRKEWNQPDLPFYWVQLASYFKKEAQPGDSRWAPLRDAQTQTLSLPNTGQAIIIDLGEGKNIHPKNKHDVAARLVRWPLVKLYGMHLPYHSPEFKSMEIKDNKVLVTFDCFGSSLRTFDVEEAIGFAVCGADHAWHWANGKLIGNNQVELTCDEVKSPVAVRYAWANNPVCNLTSMDGLPVTPFRTDNF
jgi:sialate O-acetylesterase